MARRLIVLPAALAVAMISTAFKPMSGFYALMVVIVALRIWRKRQATNNRRQVTVKNNIQM
jgi:hypothetical protein